MGALKGTISARRYQVMGELPVGFQDEYIAKLNDNAFRDALTAAHKEERLGWVQVHNLLDTDFDDLNMWLYQQYAVFQMRVDKKVLPAKLFQATFQKRQQTWCKANNREKVPFSVKQELRETLELEMLAMTLPRVTTAEVVWNTAEGWVLFHSHAEAQNDRFRKLFHRTFGFILKPFTPFDYLSDLPDTAARLMSGGTTDLRAVPE
jgi:DNA recombination-dependent growth factor C